MNEKKITVIIFIVVAIICLGAGFISGRLSDRTTIRQLNSEIRNAQNQNEELGKQLVGSWDTIKSAQSTVNELRTINTKLNNTIRGLRNENKKSRESIVGIIGSIEKSISSTESITDIIEQLISGIEKIKKAVCYQ